MRLSRGVVSIWSLALFSASSNLLAQTLPNRPGLSEIQKPAADAIASVCPQLASRNATLTSEQRKLWDSCRAMLHSASAPASGSFGLGLNDAQLRDALQGVAPEEVSVQGRSSVETSGSNAIGLRLFNLRSGAGGPTVSLNGGPAIALLKREDSSDKQILSGGGAGMDDLAGRLGGFLNVNYNSGDKNTTEREDGELFV